MLTYSNIIEYTVKHGGGTFNASLSGSADLPGTGYMVGVKKIGQAAFSKDRLNDVTRLLDSAREAIADLPEGNYIGTWLDKGIFYVDISELFTNEAEATQYCIDKGELAYYDISLGESVNV